MQAGHGLALVRRRAAGKVTGMEQGDRRRELRHRLRGAFHNLQMTVHVLKTINDPEEQREWLDHVAEAAEECDAAAGAMAELPDPGERPAGT